MTAVFTAPRAEPRELRGVVPDVLATAAFGVAASQTGHPLATWLILAYLISWPGDLLRRAIGVPVRSLGERLVYAVGSSLVVLVLLTVMVEGMSLLIGIGRPFAHGPLLGGTIAMSVVMVLVGHREGAADAGPWLPESRVWVLAVAFGAPLLAIGGAKWVDNGRGPGLSLVAFGLLAGTGALALVRAHRHDRRADADLGVLVFGLALAVAWSFSMRTQYLFGYDLHQELATVTQTLRAEVWRPEEGNPYNASLSLSSVPTGLVAISGVAPVLLLKALYPVLLAMLPTATYLMLRRMTSAAVSVALAVFVGLSPLGFWQVAVISRQEMAFGIFAALLMLLVVGQGPTRSRHLLALVLGLGIVLVHYSTAYVAIALFTGAVLLTWVARRWTRTGASPARAVPWFLPVAMVVLAFLWGNVLNQSTQNVDRTARTASAQTGLKDNGSWLESFLKGNLSSSAATPREVFAAAQPIAAQRPWLNAYSPSVQDDFPATPAATPRSSAVLPELAGISNAGFTVLRQTFNLGVGLAGILLAGLVVLRRRFAPPVLPLMGLVGSGLAISIAVRFNGGLASAYNAERLVVQLAPVLSLALVLGWQHLPHGIRGRKGTRGGAGVLLAVMLVAAIVDSTGLRGVLTGWTAGNLKADDEYVLRYRVTAQDEAASDWLSARFDPSNQVYADRYGALVLADNPGMRQGVFDTMVPALLDQRAYIFATTENWKNGRVRSQIDGKLATYAFPRAFMQTYKTLAYDNGSARVYD